MNALFSAYEALDLGNLSWAYWHARTATVHIAPAHFGAAIEALQRAYDKSHPGLIATTVLDRAQWKPLKDAISRVIAAATIPEDSKAIMSGNVHKINHAPQREILKAIFRATGIDLGADEDAAWRRRNDAAHGTPIPEGEELAAIREMKLLTGLFHRMLLRISDASDAYIDYVSLGNPLRPLKEPPSMAAASGNSGGFIHAIGDLGFSNRNSVTSVVFIDVFAFPIRNITLILKRRAKATCEAIPSASAFALLVCGELSNSDPPMCVSVSTSSAALVALAAPFVAFSPVPSVAFLRSSLIVLTACQIVVKLGIGDAKGAARTKAVICSLHRGGQGKAVA